MATRFLKKIDRLFTNCRAATMAGGRYNRIENAALAVAGGKISWIGPMVALPDPLPVNIERTGCNNHWILPGFVDCHTHLIWAGSRAEEFEMRLAGASYADIAKAGGGIFPRSRPPGQRMKTSCSISHCSAWTIF